MSDTPINLSEFGAQAAVRFFLHHGLTPLQRRAIEFTYERENASEFLQGPATAEKRRTALGLTVEKIHYRYDLFKRAAPFIAPNPNQQRMDALAIAVICDEHVESIDGPIDPPPPARKHDNENFSEIVTYRDDGFGDEQAVEMAKLFREEARVMMDHGFFEDAQFDPESVFLAHVDALQFLRDLSRDFDVFSPDDLQNFLAKELYNFGTFAQEGTILGNALLEQLAVVEKVIVEDALGFKVTSKARLSLIKSPGSSPAPENM